jgi:hypothetical protein
VQPHEARAHQSTSFSDLLELLLLLPSVPEKQSKTKQFEMKSGIPHKSKDKHKSSWNETVTPQQVKIASESTSFGRLVYMGS